MKNMRLQIEPQTGVRRTRGKRRSRLSCAFVSPARLLNRRNAGLVAAVLFSATRMSAAQKDFAIDGATLSLEEVTGEVGVTYQSMRYNRAANVWNFEVALTNRSARAFNGPFVLAIESFSGSSR